MENSLSLQDLLGCWAPGKGLIVFRSGLFRSVPFRSVPVDLSKAFRSRLFSSVRSVQLFPLSLTPDRRWAAALATATLAAAALTTEH